MLVGTPWDMSLNEGIGREEVAEAMGGYMNKSQRGWGLALGVPPVVSQIGLEATRVGRGEIPTVSGRVGLELCLRRGELGTLENNGEEGRLERSS